MQTKIDQMANSWHSKEEILSYGKRLINGTLRTVRGINEPPTEELNKIIGGRSRGSFGSILEKYYYGITPGNDSRPDFLEAEVELKTTPIKKISKGRFSAKERLVLGMINYIDESNKNFETSSFLKKGKNIMLISYLYEQGLMLGDSPIKIAEMLSFNELPEGEKKIIREDWKIIHTKIVNNRAHELSEGDTFYLGACTKSANSTNLTKQSNGSGAKPRAYSFKSGYMTLLTRRYLGIQEEVESILKKDEVKSAKSFEEIVIERFNPYIGKSVEQIKNSVDQDLNTSAKNFLAILSTRIMGVKTKKIAEFENAEVQMKTIQLIMNGTPKESMSFPAFKFKKVINEVWESDYEEEESNLKKILQRKFFFVVFQCDKDCKSGDGKILKKVFFWTMPTVELDTIVKDEWHKNISAIRESDINSCTKIRDNKIIHVRPHGRKGVDVDELPNGSQKTKQSFWLNAGYLKNIIELSS